MLNLLKAEFKYHKTIFIVYLSLIPLISIQACYSVIVDLSANYVMGMLMLALLQNWIASRNKERRERKYTLLPISIWKIALTRISFIMLTCTGAWVAYFLMTFFIKPAVSLNHTRFILILGLMLIMFSIYYVLRDLLLDFFNRIGWTKDKRKMAAVVIVLGLTLFLMGTFIFALRTEGTATPPSSLIKIIRYFLYDNPFTECIVLGMILVMISIFTFNHRKSYLE
ncbi:MAG: hypothetical protein ACE5HX_00710 [bacterium]